MNKLFLLCLLSIMILYTQCDGSECTTVSITGDDDEAKKAACKEKDTLTYKCTLNTAKDACIEDHYPCLTTAIPTDSALAGTTKADFCADLKPSLLSNECILKSDNSACEENELPCETPIPPDKGLDDDTKKSAFCKGLSTTLGYQCVLSDSACASEKIVCGTAIPSTVKNDQDKAEFCFNNNVPDAKATAGYTICVYQNGKCVAAKPCTDSESCQGLAASDYKKGCTKDNDLNTCVQTKTLCSFGVIGNDGLQSCEGLPTSDSQKTCAKESGISNKCHEVSKPVETSSGSILNAFKITFAFIIIFAIL